MSLFENLKDLSEVTSFKKGDVAWTDSEEVTPTKIIVTRRIYKATADLQWKLWKETMFFRMPKIT